MMHLWRKLFRGLETSHHDDVATRTTDAPSMAARRKMVCRFGKKGHNKGQFNMPCGVAVTKAGDIVVTDTENNRVQVFSCNGQLKVKFGEKGSEPHQLNHPMCVALSTDGSENIVVTDSVNACLKVFAQDGSFIRPHCDGRIFDFPYGIAITKDSHFVVTDICKHAVIIVQPNGSMKCRFGTYGTRTANFDHPYFVATNSKSEIIVSDYGNTMIKTFNMEGEILWQFGLCDFRLFDEHFILLQDLTVDPDDNIIVIGNSTIYIIAKNGRLWEVILPEDGLHSPKGVAYSLFRRLVVTQCGLDNRHEISVFRYHKEDYRSLRCLPRPAMKRPVNPNPEP